MVVSLALVGGLVEGAGFLIFQEQRWLNWEMQIVPANEDLLWAAPAMNLVVFLTLAVVAMPVIGRSRRVPWTQVALTLFGSMVFYEWLAFSGRLRETGAAILAIGAGTALGRWLGARPGVSRWCGRAAWGITTVAVLAGVAGAGFASVGEWWRQRALPAGAPGGPNVLVIVLDTLRADRLGCYGHERPTSPFLDALAAEGARFHRASSTSSWTLPSHASLFTGRYLHEHGADINVPLDRSHPTLAEVFAAHGYSTGAFAANNSVVTSSFGLTRGFQHWEGLFFGPYDAAVRTLWGRKLVKYVLHRMYVNPDLERLPAPEINRRLLAWLDARSERPFFAFVNYMEMHYPLAPPLEFAKQFSNQPENIARRNDPFLAWPQARPPQKDPRRDRFDAYDASLAYLDAQVRDLFANLRRRGLDRNLLVVVTSDHGESIGEHNVAGHRNSLYPEQVQIPLILRFPARIKAGGVSQRPVSLRDVPATVLFLAGLDPRALGGASLIAADSRFSPGSSPAIAELQGTPYPGVRKDLPVAQGWVKALATPEWYFIMQQNGKTELFAWPAHADQPDLSDSPEGIAAVAELRKELDNLTRAGGR